eukprot:8582717-Ditylum_brightwellii.AAC.1
MEGMVYRKGQPNTAELTLSERLVKLETKLGVDEQSSDICARISTLKECIAKMTMLFSELENNLFEGACGNKTGESLHDRLFSLGRELGLEPNSSALMSELSRVEHVHNPANEDEIKGEPYSFDDMMSEIQGDIKALSLRILNIQHHVYDQTKSKELTCALSERLSALEEELCLQQKDKPLLTRISGLEKSIVMRIVRFEEQTLGDNHSNKPEESLEDKLRHIEKALGVIPASP